MKEPTYYIFTFSGLYEYDLCEVCHVTGRVFYSFNDGSDNE